MSEVYCLNQLDIDKKPCIMANVAGYYDMLKAFYTQMMTEGFWLTTVLTNSFLYRVLKKLLIL